MDVAEQARARERSGSSADIPGPSSAQATSAPAAVTNLQPRRSVKEPALPWVIILLLAVAFVGLQVWHIDLAMKRISNAYDFEVVSLKWNVFLCLPHSLNQMPRETFVNRLVAPRLL